MRWARFRGVSSSYAWGVSGATALSLTTGTPPPVVDLTAPFTTVDGAGAGWRQTPAKLVFTASDAGSGVDFIEAGLDGAELAKLPDVPGTLDVSGQGVHAVQYRAVDKDGNVEIPRSLTVRIDAEAPVTSARAARVLRGAAPRCGTASTTLRRRRTSDSSCARAPAAGSRTLNPGLRRTNALRASTWRCTLPRGSTASPLRDRPGRQPPSDRRPRAADRPLISA